MKMNISDFTDEFIKQSEKGNIVVFTGAGMSTASGIKDFRGDNGLYKENVNAEEILSLTYFKNNPKEFYDFYRNFLIINKDVVPNKAHILLKDLEEAGLIKGIITQNIDGLDKKAGCKNVIEIHGNGVTFSCPTCHSKYNSDDIISSSSVPVCTKCNDVLKPDIILYEEMLDEYKLMESRELVNNATTMLVMGSSLVVNPAASLVHDFLINMKFDRTNSKKIFIVNKGSTAYDGFKEIIRYNGNIIDFVDEFQRRRKK